MMRENFKKNHNWKKLYIYKIHKTHTHFTDNTITKMK